MNWSNLIFITGLIVYDEVYNENNNWDIVLVYKYLLIVNNKTCNFTELA